MSIINILPAEPREAASRGRVHRGPSPPRLKPVEETLFVLMNSPGEWFEVDTWDKSQGAISALCNALRRRGAEVYVRHQYDGRHGYARWTHDVPKVPRTG